MLEINNISTKLEFPAWFGDATALVFAVKGVSVDLGTPTTTIECLTESIMGIENAKDMKYIATAIYHLIYPIFVLMVMLFWDVVVVFVVYPPLERRGFFSPSEPKKYREWLNERTRPVLEKALEDEQVPEKERAHCIQVFEAVMNSKFQNPRNEAVHL